MDAMLRSMTAVQLLEWQHFSVVEPFGEERADYRTASIVQVLVNAHRDVKRRPKAVTLEDVLLRFGDSERPGTSQAQTWQEMKRIGLMAATAYK